MNGKSREFVPVVICVPMDQVTSPEKTGSGDVKTEKTKKRQKLQKKLKTNKKNKKAKKLKKLKKGKNYKKN